MIFAMTVIMAAGTFALPAFDGFGALGNGGHVYAASASDLSGDQRADIIKIAKSCEGKTLSKTKTQLKKYGKTLWNGTYKGDWCAWFISNCAVEAGVKKSIFPRSTIAGTSTFGKYKAKGKYTPKPGDVALFGKPGSTYHVELVYSVSSKGTVKTIGGNTGNNSWKYSVVSKPQVKSGIYGYVPIQYPAQKVSHTFSYNMNGGSGSVSSATVKDGGTLTIPSTKPTRTGYDFQGYYVKRLADGTWHVSGSGWVAEKNLSGKTRKTYQPGTKYTIDNSWTKGSAKSNYTFYAQWKLRQEFTLKFNPNTGTGSMPQQTIKLTGGTIAFDTVNQFKKAGYEMNGWNVQRIALDGTVYWIVPDGSGWKWKKNAAVSERKLYKYTDRFTFGTNGIAAGDTIVVWATWKSVPAAKQTVEDGAYHIVSALDPEYGLDVCDAGTANGTNVQLYRNVNDDSQTFDVRHLGGGYYSITATSSGKHLDVAGARAANKTNVLIWEEAGGDNQKWIIHDLGNGYYAIISKCNGLWLDVNGGKAANGVNISMYQDNGSRAQSWEFVPAEEPDSDEGMMTDDEEYDVEEPDIEEPDVEEPDVEEPDLEEPDPEEPDDEEIVSEDPDSEEPDAEEPVYVWSDWAYSTTPVEASDSCEVQAVKEYRFRDKQTTTRGEDTLSGWTKYDTKTSVSTSGYKFGTPVSTTTSYANNKKTVTSAVEKGYYYYAYVVANPSKTSDWCYYADKSRAKVISHMKNNFSSSSAWAEKRLRYFWYISPKDLGATSGKLNKTIPYCADSSVGIGTLSQTGTHAYDNAMFRYNQCYKVRTETTTNYFYKWGSWSSWSATAYTASGNRQVETRTIYKYRTLVEE